MSRLLVTGGVRSGKSGYASRRAAGARAPVVVVATGSADDPEMAQRVAAHRAARPADWDTRETTDLEGALADAPAAATVLVDDLDAWLARRMGAAGLWTDAAVAALDAEERAAGERLLAEVRAFWTAAGRRPGLTILVAGQPGWGPAPTGASTRRYLDLHGRTLQALAAAAEEAVLVVAGRPLRLPAPVGQARDDPGGIPGRLPPDGIDGGRQRRAAGGRGGNRAAEVPAALREHGDVQVPPGCLNLAVNVLPGPPAELARDLAAGVENLEAYPDAGPARRAAAARHGRPEGECLVLNGAAEAFPLLARALRLRLAACIHPGFTGAEAALRAAGVPVARVMRDPEAGFALDPGAVPEEADLVVLGRPDNPTGVVDPEATVGALCRPGRTVLVDEAFAELLPDASGLAGRRDLPGLVVVRSLTKIWGLAGLRVGYLVGEADLVARLGAARQPWPVNALACRALLLCLELEGPRRRRAEAVAAEREQLIADLRGLPGLTVWPGRANFLLLRGPRPGLRRALLSRGVAVRRGETFPGLDASYLRVAVRDRASSQALVAALRRVVQGEAVDA